MKRYFALLLCTGCLGLQGVAAQSSAPLSEDDPAVWAARRLRVESLRAEAGADRQQFDAVLEREEAECRTHFFENACKSAARERWIVKINKVRAIEIEAAGLERAIRAHDIAVREQEREKVLTDERRQAPPMVVDAPSAPSSSAGASAAASSLPAAASAPRAGADAKARAKAADAARVKAAAKAQARENAVREAAERARRAREDAARYEQRAKAAAERNAKDGKGK